MIIFKSVEYKNIMSIGNHPIKIKLNDNPNVLVSGLNGSGKSTALNAIVVCLYGKLLNNLKQEQAINSINKKNLLVSVEFDRNGESWKVVRGFKPRLFELYRNDELIDAKAHSNDQQAYLNLILGMDFKIFTQLVALNKERYVPFMEMPAADRRKIVEDVLSISIFSVMNSILKEKRTASDRTISTLTRERELLKEKLLGITRVIEEIQSNKQTQIDQLKIEKEELENKLKNEIDPLIEDLQTKLIESVDDKIKEIQSQLDEFSKLGADFEHQITQYTKTKKFFEQNDVCPTCKQDITDDLKQNKVHECQSHIAEAESTMSEMLDVIEPLVDEKNKLKKLKAKNEEVKLELNKLQSTKKYEESTLRTLTTKIETLVEKLDNDDKLELEQKNKESIESKITNIEQDLETEYTLSEQYKSMTELLKDDGVKSLIIKDYNSIMNKKINEYLNAMGFYVNMTIDENFKETFHSMNKESFSYENLSTGQKTRLNLAITLALLEVASVKNSVSTNLLWMDEILEALDEQGVISVTQLFREKLSHKNIFVVTQRAEEFSSLFDSSIKFKLVDNFTEMVV